MSHTDIIIITATLFFTSTVGVYAAIRCINKHWAPAQNRLVRRGDIELVDYIEPSTNNNLDLLEPQPAYIYDRIPTYFSEYPPTYFSEYPPSYHTNNFDLLNISNSGIDYNTISELIDIITKLINHFWS